MGRVQAIVALAFLTFASGCAETKFWKKQDQMTKFGDGVPSAPLSSAVTGADRNDVIQASATIPITAATRMATQSTFSKMTGKIEKRVQATEITILWRNKIDHLPDPTRNGAMGAGLVGQLFLFGPGMQFAPADGKLTVALYDETARAPGQAAAEPQVWEFTKETLKSLMTPDERFGMSYALFLPWPSYRPDVTSIRIAARYEPEQGNKLYPPESRITIDNSGPGGNNWTNQPFVPAAQSQPASGYNALGGPPPASGPGLGVLTSGSPPPAPPMGTLQPAPANYGSLAPVGAPAGVTAPNPPVDTSMLPPIAFTAPRRPQ